LLQGSGFGHNSGVRSLSTLRRLALFVLLLLVSAPEASGYWQCEGRACGVTPWLCCCESPVEARDAKCLHATRSPGGRGVCPSGCNCVMTVRPADVRQPDPAPRPSLAYLPALVSAPLPAPELPHSELMARSIEARGPPLPLATVSAAVLRGPPSGSRSHRLGS